MKRDLLHTIEIFQQILLCDVNYFEIYLFDISYSSPILDQLFLQLNLCI